MTNCIVLLVAGRFADVGAVQITQEYQNQPTEAPTEGYEPLSFATKRFSDVTTCQPCSDVAPCVSATGQCIPLICIQEVPTRASRKLTGFDQQCTFQQCPRESRSKKCLQPSKDIAFEIALGILLLHLLLVAKDVSSTIQNMNLVSVLTGSLLLIDVLGYLIMSGGYGHLTRCCDGRFFFFARTITWLFTTPLMIFVLCLLTRTSTATTALLIVLDMLMVVSGGIASSICSSFKWFIFAFSFCCFLPILYFMCMKFQNKQGPLLEAHKFLRGYSLLWVLYAVVWVLSSGTGWMCVNLENICYIILDILAKVSFSVAARKVASMQAGFAQDAVPPPWGSEMSTKMGVQLSGPSVTLDESGNGSLL